MAQDHRWEVTVYATKALTDEAEHGEFRGAGAPVLSHDEHSSKIDYDHPQINER